ncbi:MAG: hypothetical protein K2V38_08345, partial [Gemmataceae bacterium]|nr:hypothetical protein [Gemmataceae bacterium]
MLPPLNAPLTWKSADPAVKALLDDLPANILKGHGRDKTINLFLEFKSDSIPRVKEALRQLSGQLKTAHQQLREAEEFAKTKKDAGVVRCFFLTRKGYDALGLAAKAPVGQAFSDGMKARRAELLDPEPADLDPHFRDEIHALLLLADNNAERLQAERDSVVESLDAVGISVVGEE